MKILYDGHVYRMQPVGGISRYLANIVGGLPADWIPTISVGNTKWSELERLKLPSHRNLEIKHFPAPWLRPKIFRNWASNCFFSKLESQKDFNLLHAVHHGSLAPRRPDRRHAPFVVTIHDMIPQIYSNDLDAKGNDLKLKRQAVESADAVICISESTRKDLLERISIPEDRIRVIYLASSLNREWAAGDKEAVPERPYFIFVGARKAAYKNFTSVLRAFARTVEKWNDLELCVVGPPFDKFELQLLHQLKIQSRVKNLQTVDDPHLNKLYQHSLALIYPSWYEGFGIPPLEAMACGSLAIVSNTSSLPEVAGEAAIMIDPHSIDALVDGMLKVCNLADDQRLILINRGMAWASRFKWSKTISNTIELYKSLIR
jgi:glycosyltransferase involved in cell wall biosynthesis